MNTAEYKECTLEENGYQTYQFQHFEEQLLVPKDQTSHKHKFEDVSQGI